MSNARRRITEKPRRYEGEDEAETLVNWLNATKDEAGKGRIIHVISLFFDLAHYESKEERRNFFKGKDGYIYEKETPDSKAREQLYRELRQALGYYTMRPTIIFLGGFDPDGNRVSGPTANIEWFPVEGSKMHRHQLKTYWPGIGTEAKAIKTVLALIESQAIFKIELCRCEKFFYRRFSHQKFCTSKCRLAEFRDSEESRKKRNDYARKLYHLHKKLDSGKTK